MRKIYIILTTLFVGMSSLFAGIDVNNIPEIINGENHAKFALDRLEAVGRVSETYDVKIAASILDISSSIFNNNYAVSETSLEDNGNIGFSTVENTQSFMFPQKMFLGFSMNVGGIGFGFGYQFAYSGLTLGDLSLDGVQSMVVADDDGANAIDYSSLMSDRMITSHTFSFGMSFAGGALVFNTPFSITAANNEYYSTVFTASESEDEAVRATPEGNVAFSMLPSITYNTTGRAFKYITGTLGFGMNKGTDISNDYEQGYAFALSLEVELGLNLITDPINILIQPDIYMAFGINSSHAVIDAQDTSAQSVQYSVDNKPILIYLNVPVEFSSSIGNAITLYAAPQLGLYYSSNGLDMAVIDDDIYGIMYGIEAGVGFTPIENLLFNFDIHAIGGPAYTLKNSDYVYVLGGDVVNSSSFTLGLNASLIWKF